MSPNGPPLSLKSLWAYMAVCAPLMFLIGACIWGLRSDLDRIRTSQLGSELSQLRAQTVRRAGRLEFLIERSGNGANWEQRRSQNWFQAFWKDIELAPHQLYAAVVDEWGTIIMHSDQSRVGERLRRGWYERRVDEAGEDVVRTAGSPLVGEAAAYDIAVPLTIADEWIGDYHEGLDANWLDAAVAAAESKAVWKWLWLTAGALALDAAAIAGLLYLARGHVLLRQTLRRGAENRARELAQLGSGLAHEIRNPLHALRINLHLLRRALGGKSSLGEDQLTATIQDSEMAIDRLGSLMHDLLQFADPHTGKLVEIDLSREVQATLNLLAEDLRRDEIDVCSKITSEAVHVAIDPARLRQLILNLLTFAQHKAGRRGTIEVEVARRGAEVELAVADSGPPLPEEQQVRVFEPFQAPAETGSGLGLALVQVYAEEVGGRVVCQRRVPIGNRFRLWLPLVHSAPTGGKA